MSSMRQRIAEVFWQARKRKNRIETQKGSTLEKPQQHNGPKKRPLQKESSPFPEAEENVPQKPYVATLRSSSRPVKACKSL
jgi:hypothetical protein